MIKIVDILNGEETTSDDLSLLGGNFITEIEIPKIVTMRQARLVLLQAGLLHQVQTAIDSLPSPQKEAAQIEWDYSSEVHRNKPFVVMLGSALGLSNEQLDNLFITASQL